MPKPLTHITLTLDQVTLQTVLMALNAQKLAAAAAEISINNAVAAQLRATQEHEEAKV
jgi:hypothetical protein